MREFSRTAVAIFLVALVGLVSCKQDEDAAIDASRDDGRINISIDTEEMEQETQEAIEASKRAGRRALDETGEALQKAGEAIESEGQDETSPE
jgi:hypothetical protein